MAVTQTRDAVIIGGGHNGLVCAFYLAKAGLKVTVCEARGVVGGAAVTEEFHPGFRNSVASYTVSLLNPRVIADMGLRELGLTFLERPISNFLPISDDKYIKLGGGLERTQEEFRKYSRRDAEVLPAYYAMLDEIGDILRDLAQETPPNLGDGLPGLLRALRQGGRLAFLSRQRKRDLLDLFTKSARDVLDGWFESEPVKAAFGFDAVVGNFASPDTPGSAYVLLHHTFGEVNGKKGAWGHAVGGMGAITQAMAKACEAAGVEILLDAPVEAVHIDGGKAAGVQLVDGRQIMAPIVSANVNPALLYKKLVPPSALTPDFRKAVDGYKNGSGTFRMNVALSELPSFTCLPGKETAEHHQSGIVIAPSLDYMDAAYRDAKGQGISKAPIVEMLIPSSLDTSLAPPGQHVASLFCQQFAPELPDGRSWDDAREAAADLIIDTVDQWAPGFKASVLGRMILSPLDLERKFGLIGGDIMHGHMSLDQLWATRPLLGHASHRAPIAGLYMCGAGTHPGGGVSGNPGRNAAREILRDKDFATAVKLSVVGR
ncbi:phytoene desaturase family protein [Caulobacter vibrioides]|uniref:Pyridine nucleotide-disulfide oxidoreductase domain-containing protein 2 n=2 Tax=Caulobacter vibrioides TaxID=155892 RepID=Q9A3T1_CAUVC|nr:NAD(P)/FAD-dependent oxidoreductase [Caulobacter vibrioides]YP_002518594.1 NAD(P)/FAD-dependent oxidoreductase [Caulobacter vibrioides NA1000]AAK25083.1 phytoene dehydrogenase-related protein [Caulobacter vibrioides CB15]ACL96686.1 NAD(P)/FAD-dependent oxidoreductase [Caulobacter vibrioides NA1000]ATC29947.1 NAD(P)/FAD-dependent oxidoreductase [Caulobacter vibrioides]QXZ51470.1 NAD(P)/FAD-dependent oxidoreductase [Caulobacter vibrioides]